ncbi:MAG: hypothetical protein KAH56_10285 [Candidatus Krumholzibacteria bacterium]|nr:hypothetical protein [Candidatus Krumholzibacteria bacterium]
MARRSCILLSTFLICLLVIPVTYAQTTGVGGPYGEYDMAYQGSETLTLFVVPDGSGDSFDQASLPFGGTEDATITVLLVDGGWLPIAYFPAEDIWLESEDNGLVPCMGGTIADANTGTDGRAQWREPPLGGGQSQALTVVMVNGMLLELTSGVRLSFNSPDINGDLMVDLTDLQLFAVDFFSSDDFRSDFHRDGIVNLSDLPPMALAIGANCP